MTAPLPPILAPGGRPVGAHLAGAVADAAALLAGAGVASPRADAEQLAAHVLGVSRGRLAAVLAAGGRAPLPPPVLADLRDATARRASRIPLQHIVGTTGFRHLVLDVGPGVFVPRPETEAVAGWAIDALATEVARPAGAGPCCVDLCTGSGAVALALADEVPGARVHAVDADPGALAWARRNVERTGLAVTLYQARVGTGEALDALAGLAGRVDLVVANPPYLPDGVRGTLEPEVAEHDPPQALWGGPDGLDGVRAVARTAAGLLAPGGLLVVEHDDTGGEAAPALLAALGGWDRMEDHNDLAGRARFVTARKIPPCFPTEDPQ
jgi:release factor glutamine methyltransferase